MNLQTYLMNENITVIQANNEWYSFFNSTDRKTNLETINNFKEVINNNEIQVINFKDAELRFDKLFGKFTIENQSHILMVKSPNECPEKLKLLI